MKRRFLRFTLLTVLAGVSAAAMAQPPQGFGGPGGPGGFGGPGGPREDRKLVEQFDEDENGWLDRQERAKARTAATEAAGDGRGGFGRPGVGPPGGGGRGPRGRGNREPAKPGRQLAVDQVEHFQDAGLYDPTVLRTLFFEFENQDWEKELEDFHGTDVEVPATLIVDGKRYTNVGVKFRGQSSYGMVPTGYKRSLNVSIDLAEEDQRLYGYQTLNLLNSSGDPSFMSTVLYSHIAGQYLPAPKANHVRVVINGESWGVYVNVQQFNKDFLAEHYESPKGTRWKASGSPRADAGLRYLGDDLEEYKQRFEMKSNDGKKAWKALVKLCQTLNETPLDELERQLDPMLDIDETLRFLALDVALVNSDGYWTRASDYSLFLDSDKQFHVIPHDMNEAFQSGGGRGPGGPGGPGGRGPGGPGGGRGPGGPGGFGPGGFGPGGPGGFGRDDFGPPPGGGFGPGRPGGGPPNDDVDGERRRGRGGFGGPDAGGRAGGQEGGGPGGRGGGPGHGGVDLDPLVAIDNPRMPLRSRLLSVPSLRSKYLQYVREIAEQSLAWNEVEPVISRHAKLIEEEVAVDTRKLETLEAFEQATSLETPDEKGSGPSLRRFFEQRQKFLLEYKEPVDG